MPQAALPSKSARLAFGLAALASCLPFLLGPYWIGTDYLNHLARMEILMRAGTSAAHPAYVTQWGLYPNLAMDLLVPPLGRLVGAVSATKIFLIASALLVATGAVAVARARGTSWLPSGIAALLTLYAFPFAIGFVNFEFGLGLALWSLAAWIALADRPAPLRILVHALAVPCLAASHLVALGLYGFAIGCLELQLWRESRDTRRLLGRAAWMAAPPALLALALAGSGDRIGGVGLEWGLSTKPVWLIALNGFSPWISAVCALPLAVLLYALAREGRARLVGAGPLLAFGFALLFVAMPFRILDTAYADVRIAVAAALILPAFLRLDLTDRRWRLSTVAVCASVGAVNVAAVARVQIEGARDLREIVASFDRLPRGARVLVGATALPPPFEDPLAHAPTLAAAFRDAFVPTLFSYPGKQPLVARPDLAAFDAQADIPLPIDLLRDGAEGRPLPPGARYAAAWTRHFDFVYLIGPQGPNPLPERLDPLAQGRAFALYRTRPSSP